MDINKYEKKYEVKIIYEEGKNCKSMKVSIDGVSCSLNELPQGLRLWLVSDIFREVMFKYEKENL